MHCRGSCYDSALPISCGITPRPPYQNMLQERVMTFDTVYLQHGKPTIRFIINPSRYVQFIIRGIYIYIYFKYKSLLFNIPLLCNIYLYTEKVNGTQSFILFTSPMLSKPVSFCLLGRISVSSSFTLICTHTNGYFISFSLILCIFAMAINK